MLDILGLKRGNKINLNNTKLIKTRYSLKRSYSLEFYLSFQNHLNMIDHNSLWIKLMKLFLTFKNTNWFFNTSWLSCFQIQRLDQLKRIVWFWVNGLNFLYNWISKMKQLEMISAAWFLVSLVKLSILIRTMSICWEDAKCS